MMVGFAKQLYD